MIITVLSWKGGVGKSTISQNLLVYLATNGQPTALIDADNNKSSLAWYGFRPEDKPIPGSTVVGNTDHKSLVKTIKDMAEQYENVIVDCPPVDSPVTTRALLAADVCIVPVTPSGGGDIWATQELFEHIEITQERIDRKFKIFVVLNRFRPNINLHNDYIKALKEHEEDYDIKFSEHKLNERISFGYANADGLSVLESNDQKAINQFTRLAEALLK